MITGKNLALRPILESSKGLHLTAYIVNNKKIADLKNQLRDVIQEADQWLQPVHTPDERKKFLEPLESLLNNNKILNGIKGNIGIFRNQESFRVLNIPIAVPQLCQVATSFHVKPLLRWLQDDEEFLFLGIEDKAAHLYLGNQYSFKLLDSLYFTETIARFAPGSTTKKHSMENVVDSFSWLKVWLTELTKKCKLKLFIAGDNATAEGLQKNLKHLNTKCVHVLATFKKDNAEEFYKTIRDILKEDAKRYLQKSLMEFRFAEESQKARKNIFQIVKAVVKGRVRKLIVTDDLNIFGKIDIKSGGIAIHPADLDHEDDCILDDLAQLVLNQGGEVVIAKLQEIPKGRPILAILDDDDDKNITKTKNVQYDTLKERPA